MKISPKLVERNDIEHSVLYYSQWVKIFDALRKDKNDLLTNEMLNNYNNYWRNLDAYADIAKNEYDVPEQGMLSVLGYSVAENKVTAKQINSDDGRRISLLLHIFKNECPKISDENYTRKWGKPSTIERLDKMIDVLNKLSSPFSNPNARYKRMSKQVERWNMDLKKLKEYKLSNFR